MLKTFTKLLTVLTCICFINSANAQQDLPLTFEDAAISYEIFGFGAADFTAIPAEIIANPDASGINTSGMVAHINKTEGAQTWAGASMPLGSTIDFSMGTWIELKVWSPRAGVPILCKIEDTTSPPDGNGNPSEFSEVQVNTTVANAWEVLTFDMATGTTYNSSINYNQVIAFPDFGNVGVAGGESYYFDDIQLPEPVSIDETELAKVQMSAFPNPATDLLNVQFDIPVSGNVTLSVMDALGRMTMDSDLGNINAGAHQQEVSVNSMANGTYVLVLRLDGQLIKTKTIVVQ